MTKEKIIIIGAGVAGHLLVKDIREKQLPWEIVGFLDDIIVEKPNELKAIVCPIIDRIDNIVSVIKIHDISKVIISVPSERGAFIRRILMLLAEENDVEILLLPRVSEVVFNSRVSYTDLKSVDISDLVGDAIVRDDQIKIVDSFKDQSVLVTGGGGSIGSEISKQVFLLQPKRLLILDRVEKNLFDIENDIKRMCELNGQTEVTYILGDINNVDLLNQLFCDYSIDFVFHAAAYKHVPIIENNIYEGVQNNILGTYNLVSTAIKFNCKRFVLISTDKAAKPINVMGKTKRIAEEVIDYFASKNKNTFFTSVRFGNVFNSSGSAVELFLGQIDRDSEITITDPEMTRYFMTIPEAVHLVLLSTFMDQSNKKYILEMGKPINIHELAMSLVRAKGRKVSEVEFKIIGFRPGEKKHEILYNDEREEIIPTTHKRIHSISRRIGKEEVIDMKLLNGLFMDLELHYVKNHSKQGEVLLEGKINNLIF